MEKRYEYNTERVLRRCGTGEIATRWGEVCDGLGKKRDEDKSSPKWEKMVRV